MGKKLAIRGHSTRGNEVIKLLEMLGGKNIRKLDGALNMYSYYLIDNLITSDRLSIAEDDDFEIFTLQGFLEKFPFKIHDLVNIPEYESTVGICGMRWDPYSKYVEYMVYRNDDEEWYTAEELLEWNDCFYDSETKENDMRKTGYTLNELIDLVPLTSDSAMIAVREGFEIIEDQGKFFLKPIKPKYPTTYDECCNILNADEFVGYELMTNFPKLINARNAYWKIAGEELGLGKPWEPKHDYDEEIFFIYCDRANGINIGQGFPTDNFILSFPTKEMRDAFYKNFKYLIETCKELL